MAALQASPSKLANPAVLTGGNDAVYVPDAVTTGMINSIIMHNQNGTAVVVECWLVPTGQAVGARYKVFKLSIDPDQTDSFREPLIMTPLDTLYLKSSVASVVSVFVNGAAVVSL